MAGINAIGIRTKTVYTYTYCALKAPGEEVPQTPTKILLLNFPLWPKRTYAPNRQSHCTTRKGRGLLRLAPNNGKNCLQ